MTDPKDAVVSEAASAVATQDAVVRKPGRPRKFGQGRINATVRFTPERYEELRLEADRNGRSISEQVEFLIEQMRPLERAVEALQSSYFISHQAGESALAECVRLRLELDELKTAMRATELADYPKLGRDELTEIIEAAVTRALARARLTINGTES